MADNYPLNFLVAVGIDVIQVIKKVSTRESNYKVCVPRVIVEKIGEKRISLGRKDLDKPYRAE